MNKANLRVHPGSLILELGWHGLSKAVLRPGGLIMELSLRVLAACMWAHAPAALTLEAVRRHGPERLSRNQAKNGRKAATATTRRGGAGSE